MGWGGWEKTNVDNDHDSHLVPLTESIPRPASFAPSKRDVPAGTSPGPSVRLSPEAEGMQAVMSVGRMSCARKVMNRRGGRGGSGGGLQGGGGGS